MFSYFRRGGTPGASPASAGQSPEPLVGPSPDSPKEGAGSLLSDAIAVHSVGELAVGFTVTAKCRMPRGANATMHLSCVFFELK